MKLSELIKQLQELEKELGGDIEVKIINELSRYESYMHPVTDIHIRGDLKCIAIE